MGALYGTFFLKLSQESAGKSEDNLSELVAMFLLDMAVVDTPTRLAISANETPEKQWDQGLTPL